MVLVVFLTHSAAEHDAHSGVMLDSGSGAGLLHPCLKTNLERSSLSILAKVES